MAYGYEDDERYHRFNFSSVAEPMIVFILNMVGQRTLGSIIHIVKITKKLWEELKVKGKKSLSKYYNEVDYVEMDKNKAVFKLANFPPVLWINLDDLREKYMEEQFDCWEIKDHHRISGIDGAEYESYLKGTVPPSMNDGELAWGCHTYQQSNIL